MVTLKQVAKAAGVHFTVVSTILNRGQGNSRCSQATRQHVQQVAQRLGYTRNEPAHHLRLSRTHTVGLVAGDIRNPFFAALATQLELHLRQVNYQLLLASHGNGDGHDQAVLIRSLLGKSVEAMMVWSEGAGDLRPELFPGSQDRIVWLGLPRPQHWSLQIDIAHGVNLAVRLLARQAGQRLGFFVPRATMGGGLPEPRSELFIAAARRRRLPAPEVLSYPGESWDIAAATAGAKAWLQKAPALSAVMAYNDVAAVGWLLASRHADRRLPLVSFDGTDWIRSWYPAVPYVDLRIDALARQGVLLCCQAMRNPGLPPKQVTLRPVLRGG